MTDKELALLILDSVGGKQNIISAVNCMTRLRFRVSDPSAVRSGVLSGLDGVLSVSSSAAGSVEVVVGPGRSHRCMEALREAGVPAGTPSRPVLSPAPPAEGENRFQKLARVFGHIFAPLIPGIICAGICAGISSLITQLVPGYAGSPAWTVVVNLLSGVNSALMVYLTAWAGYRAAETFSGTPILGGMLGMFMTLSNVDSISAALGLFDEAQPLNAVLRAGRGGVLAVVVGVWIMCRIERFIRKKMPASMDVVFSPLLTLLLTLVPYVLVIMPALGYISSGLCSLVGMISDSPSPVVRMAAGFISAALFLPMVAMGMHHGLIALYTVQLETLGHVTLYPALAMAGAGQVGAALALAIRARKAGNRRLLHTIAGALPAGVLGVGEPLIYGVTLPLGRPFVTAGLGAGFGGAFVMLMEVASTTWGPSGLLGAFVMTEGPHGAGISVCCYLIGLAVSCAAAFLLTLLTVRTGACAEKPSPDGGTD